MHVFRWWWVPEQNMQYCTTSNRNKFHHDLNVSFNLLIWHYNWYIVSIYFNRLKNVYWNISATLLYFDGFYRSCFLTFMLFLFQFLQAQLKKGVIGTWILTYELVPETKTGIISKVSSVCWNSDRWSLLQKKNERCNLNIILISCTAELLGLWHSETWQLSCWLEKFIANWWSF